MNDDLRKKYDVLLDILRSAGKACVAFSGGVDSTLLLKACRDALDEKTVLAITAVSETRTGAETLHAEETARAFGVKHVLLKTVEMDDPLFTANSRDRCYHCKRLFYREARQAAHARGFTEIFDGSNADDLGDYRPGRKAAAECGVRSPLVEAGLRKDDVRALSRELDLPGWQRPSNSCLASRIPYGTAITAERLAMVGRAEAFIRSQGFPAVRVRHHGVMARIELPEGDGVRFMSTDARIAVAARLKEIGFTWIAVDIEGYRAGSMNEALDGPPRA